MRDYLMRLASSPEAFLFIRKGFAHSLAAISIYGYILGIGDRHLENFLLDLKTGRLLPIDFGHAFGSATELLPIPELVPFRLTRQLVGALEPLGISGALEHVMVYILQGTLSYSIFIYKKNTNKYFIAIRDDKEILINTMDVFVKEPLLDWKKFALKQAKVQSKYFIQLKNQKGKGRKSE
jgi:phosphatidylinositol kinase/protein kinase (PI-3  family)